MQRKSFHRNLVLVASTVTVLNIVHTFSDPQRMVKVEELDITFGVADDPVDELVEFFLARVNPATLPTIVPLRNRNLWQGSSNFRVLSSVGVIDSQQDEYDMEVDQWVVPDDLDPSHKDQVLAILCESNAASQIRVAGNVDLLNEINQREWSDSGFEDMSPEEMAMGVSQ